MPAQCAKHTTGPAAVSPGRRLGPLLALGLGLILTAVAAWAVLEFWRRLPASQYQSIRAAALEEARANPTGAAREGLVLIVNSNQFTAAWQGRRSIPETRDEVRSRLVDLPDTQVGRLQLVALTLLAAERRGEPIETVWPSVQPLLSGLERAPLPHFYNEALVHEQRTYERVGLSPAVAVGAAQASLGTPHGPFLQYFVRRMTLLANVLEASGDAAASQTCRRVVRRLLRQWVLDWGPPSLGLPAAELLARELERSAPAADSLEAAIAAKCRQWRQEYHERVAATPPLPPLLRISEDPPAVPLDDSQAWLAALGWSIAVLAVFMVVALVGSIVSRFATLPRVRALFGLTVGLQTAVITLVLAWPVTHALPEFVGEDLRRVGPPWLEMPRLPLIAGGVTIAATVIAVLVTVRGLKEINRRWWVVIGTVGRAAWPVAALGVLLANAGMQQSQLLREVLPVPDGPGALTWFADPNAHGLLDDLRVWDP